MISRRRSFLLFSSCLWLHNVLANPNITAFPYEPGVSLTGMTGTFSQGAGDAMIPLAGQPLTFGYMDPQGVFYSKDQYSASGGLGFRTLSLTPNAILGAYVFGDYDHSRNNHGFWFVSPGVEVLTDFLDFSGNFYVPAGSTKNDMGTEFASSMNDFRYVTFTGHQEFDQLINTYESVGIGGDAQIGYRLPFFKNNTKIYAGVYYFSPDDADAVTGGTARLEVPVADFVRVSVSEGYDTLNHNTVKAGLTVDLGGRHTHFHYRPGDLSARLLDPLQRNLAAISGSSHAGPPIEQTEKQLGLNLVLDNIWFFRETGSLLFSGAAVTPESCTAENPCDFTQNNLTGINAITPGGANLFVESGNYTHLNGNAVVYDNQWIYGRTAGWIKPAEGNERPILFGSLTLANNTLLDSMRLLNDPDNLQFDAVVLPDNAKNVEINRTWIGGPSSDPSHTYPIGIQLNNNNDLTLNNSQINVFSAVDNQAARGIMLAAANSVLTVNQSEIVSETQAASSFAVSIYFQGGNNLLNLTDNRFILHSMGDNGLGFSIFVTSSNNEIVSENNQFDITTEGNSNSSAVAVLLYGSNNFLTMKNDVSHTTANGDDSGAAFISSGGSANIIHVDGVQSDSRTNGDNNASSAAGIGLFDGDNDQITVTNSRISAIATGNAADAYGIGTNVVAPSSHTIFIINNDVIVLSSASGNAYGFLDPAQAANSDQWSFNAFTFNAMQLNAALEVCKTKFNGVCIN